MNLFKSIIVGAGVVSVAAFYVSCTKETPHVAVVQTDFSTLGSVQVFDATVKSARNLVYVDGLPVSGVVIGYGAVLPATAYSFKVAAGMRSFLIKDTLSTTTQVPMTFSENVEAGKSYTIFTYDTTTSAKHLTVLNNIAAVTDTTARLRFGNFIYNTTAVPNVDVYSFRRGNATPVFTNIGTNQVTDFIPYASGLTDTLYVYSTGTTTPLLAKGLIQSFTPTRSYTAVYSGSFRGTKAVAGFATF